MNLEKTQQFNIAIVPPEKVSANAISLSKNLQKSSGLFVLNNKNVLPHIVLYAPEIPLRNLPKMKAVLKKAAGETKSFEIQAAGFAQNERNNLFVAFKKSKELLKLQNNIISEINVLRERLVGQAYINLLHTFNEKEQEHLFTYGFHHSMERYTPHLTLSKFQKQEPKIVKSLPKTNFDFKVTEFGLYEIGKYGNCKKLLAKFTLKK